MRARGTARARRRGQRGFVVVFSLALVAVLGMLGSTMLTRTVHESQIETRSLHRHGAFHLADAGLDQAIQNLRTPSDASDDVMTMTLPTGGSFTIDGITLLAGNLWVLTTTGTEQGEQRRMEAVVSLTPQSVFQWALFGDQQINVSGNATTDSYDSGDGAYDEEDHLHGGDIGTNAAGAGGVTVDGNIFVDGQVAVGSGVSNPTSVVTGYDPAYITGGTSPPTDTQDVVAQSQTFPMPAVSVPPELACGDYTVEGNTTITLPSPGPYCYRNLTIEGNATLTASGPVTIYLTGQLNAQGNSVVGVVNSPDHMLFLMSSTAEATLEQTIQGNNTFYGAVYGPQARFTIQGNANIYGSIVAQRIDVTGNAAIHYDEALSELTPVANTYQTALVSWREL